MRATPASSSPRSAQLLDAVAVGESVKSQEGVVLLDPAEEPDVARVAAAGSVSDVTFGHPSLSGELVEVPYSADDELGRGSTGLQRIASELLVADLYDCG